MTEARPSEFWRQIRLRLIASAGIAAAVMFGWWWRVEKARIPETMPAISMGAAVDTGRSTLTPISLQLRQEAGELVLIARIENVTGETQATPFGYPPRLPELRIDESPLADPELILLRDDAPLQQLHPRMPETVEFVWQAPPDWQPAPVEIRFQRQQFKLHDNLYGQSSWLGFTPVAHMIAAPEVMP